MPIIGEQMSTEISKKLTDINFGDEIRLLQEDLRIALETATVRNTPEEIKYLSQAVKDKFLNFHDYVQISPVYSDWNEAWHLKNVSTNQITVKIKFSSNIVNWDNWKKDMVCDFMVQSALQSLWEKQVKARDFEKRVKCIILNKFNSASLLKANFPEAYAVYKEKKMENAQKLKQERQKPACDEIEKLRAELKTNQSC